MNFAAPHRDKAQLVTNCNQLKVARRCTGELVTTRDQLKTELLPSSNRLQFVTG
jgi:hypothetical protein